MERLFSHNHIQILYLKDVPLCFCQRDGPWFLTLRLVHRYPQAIPRLRTDTGAIKFVLSGANIMCPGLTSPGATIHDEVTLLSFPVEIAVSRTVYRWM